MFVDEIFQNYYTDIQKGVRQLPNLNPATLEDARAALLEYSDLMQERETQIATLTAQNEENAREIEQLRTLNQQLFLRCTQGEETPEEPAPEPLTVNEFCKKFGGIIVK